MYRYLLSVMALVMPWIVTFFAKTNYYSDYVANTIFPTPLEDTFDFIVVGSGASGAVVARRLATVPTTRILLLEAGGTPAPLNHIPGLALDLLHYPDTDWMHKSIPQKKACFGLKNNQTSLNAGKVLGGSTTLNFMMYLRGHPKDFDNWASTSGDPEWSYAKSVAHFKKSIKHYKGSHQSDKINYAESPYGFLHLEKRKWSPLLSQLYDAGKEFGYPAIDANAGPKTEGVNAFDVFQKNGKRFGTYSSILVDLESRPNFKISRFSIVTKIKFDKNMRAEGVHYLHHGVKKFARATKELVISAGAINTPQLLMLSGIGPKEHLKSLKIKSKLDLPVGKNLQDHVVTPIMPFVINESLTFVGDRDFGVGAASMYISEGAGPLATPNIVTAHMFMTSSISRNSGQGNWPDIQVLFSPAGIFSVSCASLSRGFNLRLDLIESMYNSAMRKDAFGIFPIHTRPKSRGEILLRSKNPLDGPLIDPKYLDHPDDAKSFVDAIERSVKMFENAKSFKKLGVKLNDIKVKGCEMHEARSKAYWECQVRHFSVSVWHPVGTCKMGRSKGDKTAVVDTRLRVLGTKSLRVVDASIMPSITSANTMAPCIMIGEKGSDFIRDHWAQQFSVCDLKDHLLSRKKDGNEQKCYYSRLI